MVTSHRQQKARKHLRGGKKHIKGNLNADINVTPLVDVVLVLLIIFMVTVPLTMTQTPLEVPRRAAPTEVPERSISVTVKDDLTVVVDRGGSATVVPAVDLARTLRPLIDEKLTNKVVFVDFEDGVPWSESISIMDTIRSVEAGGDRGLVTVALVTRD
jgi:biopolymer transport protein TolR